MESLTDIITSAKEQDEYRIAQCQCSNFDEYGQINLHVFNSSVFFSAVELLENE